MPTEQERRAAMYPALMSFAWRVVEQLEMKVPMHAELTADEREILIAAREVVERDTKSLMQGNVHVHPVFGPALNAISPRVPDPSLVALAQSDVPSWMARDVA